MTEPVDPADPAAQRELEESSHQEPGPEEPGPEEPGPDIVPPERAPRRRPSTLGGACYLAVLLVATAGIVVTVADDWRLGVRVLAGALAGAAALRLLLPEREAGMLAVRHRAVDVVLLAVIAGALWWLAGSIPEQPGR